PMLRKQNKVKTIHASLAIEGNTLTEEQVTAILENKRVIGDWKEILEVKNAIEVYNRIPKFDFRSESSFLEAHRMLMSGLLEYPGEYRSRGVGIVQGSKVKHLAPPASNVAHLMKDLFDYLNEEELVLVQSCVFHYEMEFIHPFIDGNGRMGRLWQTLILREEYPIFENTPIETIISQNQKSYYSALSESDKAGNSTQFIEFMLGVLEKALRTYLSKPIESMNADSRIQYFLQSHPGEFSRKDYLKVFQNISTATASRDIKQALNTGLITSIGVGNQTKYRRQNPSVS
ncbi:MAG: Fic family protein, partial [Bacteroidota bacterium]